jgi:transposase
MLTGVEELEALQLHKKGWTISAIARHLGRDRKTVRAYVNGQRTVAEGRRRSVPDPAERFVEYLTQRLADDPHVWATTLFDEVVELGYDRSYQSFTRLLRTRGLRPHCEACQGVKGRPTIEIAHPPGAEIQWDWVELPDAPWGGTAHLLVGSLPFSGRFRAVFADGEDQAHLVWAMHGVLERLGGTARTWRVDRMTTVIKAGSADVQPSFVPVARHYGVSVAPCPPRRGNRKGSVEKSIHYLTQRWWRTASVSTMAEAQASIDRFCARTADRRPRPAGRLGDTLAVRFEGRRPTVGELAALEQLASIPAAAFPATVSQTVTVSASALARFDGNAYSVPPGLVGAVVEVRHRVGTNTVEVVSTAGRSVATHRLAPAGAGLIVRSPEHHAALESVVLGAFTTAMPCRDKTNRPPSPAARAAAARLRGHDSGGEVVVDLAAYQAIVDASTRRAR